MSAAASHRLPPPQNIHLRATAPADIPALFAIQLDPAGNELAGTKPRDRAAFDARWNAIFADPRGVGVTPRVIIADGVLAGSINIVRQADGAESLGYWIDRPHWGRGIATRAIALMLTEFAVRPLVAHVVAENVHSLRALQRNGFAVVSRAHRPAGERHQAREAFTLRLE